MNVALVRYRYSPHGGAERYLDGLLARLAGAEGTRACLLAASWEGEGTSVVPLVRIAVPPKPVPLRLFLFARAVRAWADAHPDHLIFSLERVPGADVYRAGDGCHAEWMERKRILRPLSWPLDHLRPLNLAYLRFERELFTSPKLLAVIANSERGRNEISHRFGVSRERIAVVRNGVDLARFPLERRDAASSALRSTLGIGADETIFLHVGSGFARKGVGALTRAAVRLARMGARFRVVVVGKGDAGPYRRILREGGAEGRVHFTGPVAGAAEYLLGADAFVFPTIYEPFSNACLEAMAAGLPVITTAVNGVSEVIRDGVSGLVVDDPMDDSGIAERMERLLSVDSRRRMGEEARRAAEGLTPERNAAETLSVLEEAWRKKAGPGGGAR
jgi:UDP-glucose:(heptosyl)LPS alpha-1,3-glucosyltransferase